LQLVMMMMMMMIIIIIINVGVKGSHPRKGHTHQNTAVRTCNLVTKTFTASDIEHLGNLQ